MHRLAVVFLLAIMAQQAHAAAARVTVEQLEQILAASHQKSDGQVLEKLSDLELTQRLSEVPRARLDLSLPGLKSRKRLALMADASAFLDLPADEIPANPQPDPAARASLLAMARDYVAKTILKLPNFFATRETTSYVSTVANVHINNVHTVPYVAFDEVSTSRVVVLYRNGRELVTKGGNHRFSSKEARTRGEFGPILIVIWNDASKGKVTWGHWERTSEGMLAVFQYTVPKAASHYAVTSPGLDQQEQYYPAYRGEIALNPENGAIMRLTVVPELKQNDPMTSANLVVEYREVDIGGRNYICPVKSIALSDVRTVDRDMDDKWDRVNTSLGPVQTYLNQVSFTHYRLFGSEARILTGDEEAEDMQKTARDQAEMAPPPSPRVSPDYEAEFQVANESLFPRGGIRFKVTDLEQGLARDKTYGMSDEEIALHLAKVQLTERLIGKRLATLEGEFPSLTDRQALEAVADPAEFLDLPESDIPSKPAPGKSEQAAILRRTTEYMQRTIPQPPSLTASRKSICFAESFGGERMAYGPLHKLGDSSVTVRDADGHESIVEEKKRKEYSCGSASLWEFEPILKTVVTDALKSEMNWSRWEPGDSGFLAVFSYSVPRELSHYTSVVEPRNRDGVRTSSTVAPSIQQSPAYHGELALNPADGSILRLTVVAGFQENDPVTGEEVLLEYSPVEMDGRKYIYPKRSVVLYQLSLGEPRTYLEDAVFLKYHRVP
jgi:hypothetical protein